MDLPSSPLGSPKRLAIMILLERHHCIIFSELYKTLGLTRGSVHSHLQRLEEEGYIEKMVEFVNSTSNVKVCITQGGLRALQEAKSVWKKLLDL